MIFLFSAEAEHPFWMKNTPIPLDMLFINNDRKIVGIVEEAVPFSLESRSVPAPSRFVLEINGGLCRRYGLKTGESGRVQGISAECGGEGSDIRKEVGCDGVGASPR